MEDNKIKTVIELLKQIELTNTNTDNQTNTLSIEERTEVDKLIKRFNWTVALLVLVIIGSILLLIAQITSQYKPTEYYSKLIVIVFSGLLGSATSALISILERYSFGYELSDGKKYPKSKNKARFNKRMNPFFLVRPILGISTSFLIFIAIKSGILNLTNSIEGIILFCTIGSFFSKTLIERSRQTIKTLKL